MLFSEIIGQEHIKKHLQETVKNNRIAHAQLFVGKDGVGTLAMAMAYAQFLLCSYAVNKEVCALKCEKLTHPDIHFSFPVNSTTEKKATHPTSRLFLEEWREFVLKQPYATLFDWLKFIGIENKQGNISVYEAAEIAKNLSLKSYEGGFKIQIIWMAEKMNRQAANKLLKLIEEPPKKTVLLLIAEKEELVLQTIRSRCQIIHFPNLSGKAIEKALVEKENAAVSEAKKIAFKSEGNYNNALHYLHSDSRDELFETWFVTWVRAAFKAKGNAAAIHDLIEWSTVVAGSGRETQKQFLNYAIWLFRQALLFNYGAGSLTYFDSTIGFSLENFAPFIHSANILDIRKQLEDALYHIERNGNAKIIFTDLSIGLTRLLHTKEVV